MTSQAADWSAFYSQLHGFVASRVRPAADVDDLVQLILERAAVLACMEPLLNTLPADVAQLLRWADMEGRPMQSIADQLGITLTAAKSRVQRARRSLCLEHGALWPARTLGRSNLRSRGRARAAHRQPRGRRRDLCSTSACAFVCGSDRGLVAGRLGDDARPLRHLLCSHRPRCAG